MTGKGAWSLWAVAVSCGLHATDEYLTGWLEWAPHTLGIDVPASWFIVANLILVGMASAFAAAGWRRLPTAALVIPVATLANAMLFHLLPAFLQRAATPGVYTATALYLPFSSLALIGAARDGVPRRSIGAAAVLGTCLAVGIVLLARAVS
jgi:hypothetical protein